MATTGYNILVLKSSTVIAGVKSNDIQVDAEKLEISSSTDSEWRHFLTGRKEWSVTVNYLLLSASALGISGGTPVRDVLQVGNTFTLKIKKRGDGDSLGVTGSAILTTCRISAIYGNLATGSFQFTGSGPLS